MRRFMVAIAALVLGVAGATACDTEPNQIEWWINVDRNAQNLRPVQRDARLDDFAQRHARALSTDGVLDHSDMGFFDEGNARKGGEIIGFSATTAQINQAWLDSHYHRQVILDPLYTHMGVGTVRKGARVYAAVIFEAR